MDEREFDFFVQKQSKVTSDKGTKYKLRLESGKGHWLVFVSDSENLFEGFPIGQHVRISLSNPQTVLKTE